MKKRTDIAEAIMQMNADIILMNYCFAFSLKWVKMLKTPCQGHYAEVLIRLCTLTMYQQNANCQKGKS